MSDFVETITLTRESYDDIVDYKEKYYKLLQKLESELPVVFRNKSLFFNSEILTESEAVKRLTKEIERIQNEKS